MQPQTASAPAPRYDVYAYRRNVTEVLERNGQNTLLSREEVEISNMCAALSRPATNCVGLILRLRQRRRA